MSEIELLSEGPDIVIWHHSRTEAGSSPFKYLKTYIYKSIKQMFLLIVNNYGFCSCGIETRVRHMLKSHRQFNGASRAKRR